MDVRDYSRQTALPQIGEIGQKKLFGSRVLVVGAGGLGSAALYYLCAAGIGTLGIVDFDTVSKSNLNRQILHTEQDIGLFKTQSAIKKLSALNPHANLIEYRERLHEGNIDKIVKDYDIVVDCVDSQSARLIVAKACTDHSIPLVEAGIEGFSGFVMSHIPNSACYGCLHSGAAVETGRKIPVLGATAGVAGSIQASECIKLLLKAGEPLINKILYFDLLHSEFETIQTARNPLCKVCAATS
ncbi:HesA/MoeB/ThiF family protein [Eubacteriales bacterium OttesenSCG-928-K08]|nr:HesA/MoeB/ThiF family protein [Eubacteriales bacterium OttesenSCG-928-K08]